MNLSVEKARAARHAEWLAKLNRLINNLERHAEWIKKDLTWSKDAKTTIEHENERLGTIHSDLRETYEE